ncbi:MAG: hypothetical protein IH986_15720 [Planctomycetes bacterium]|nr:hypothetical protein [Planctomycetota bacterium]
MTAPPGPEPNNLISRLARVPGKIRRRGVGWAFRRIGSTLVHWLRALRRGFVGRVIRLEASLVQPSEGTLFAFYDLNAYPISFDICWFLVWADLERQRRGLRKLHPERSIRESKGLFIVVELIRHFLIQHTTTRPSVARARVFLVRDAERMNEGAQNALLKTLEEPPPDTYLILVTASASRLLPTIRSRCQLVPFDLLPAAFVQEQLVSQGALEPVAARTLARLSGGRLGAALHWHQIGLLAAADDVCETLSGLSGRDPEGFAKGLNEIANPLAAAAIECADEEDPPELEPEPAGKRKRPKAAPKTIPTDEARAALKLVLMLIGTSYRDALLLQNEAGRELLTFERPHAIVERLAKGLPADRLDDGIRAVAAAEQMLDRNVAPQSACERLAVALLGEAAPA